MFDTVSILLLGHFAGIRDKFGPANQELLGGKTQREQAKIAFSYNWPHGVMTYSLTRAVKIWGGESLRASFLWGEGAPKETFD